MKEKEKEHKRRKLGEIKRAQEREKRLKEKQNHNRADMSAADSSKQAQASSLSSNTSQEEDKMSLDKILAWLKEDAPEQTQVTTQSINFPETIESEVERLSIPQPSPSTHAS